METERSVRQFLEPSEKPKVIYTDNSLEFGKSCEALSWNHRKSGLDEKWWADSMECCCYLREIQDLLADMKTPHETRFGEPFKGPIIPFGATVEYFPISAKDQPRLHHFGKKFLPGILLEPALVAGRTWGDVLVADMEELGHWTRQKSMLEGSMQKKQRPKRGGQHF